MSTGPCHPLWEAGAGVTQLAGSQVTCSSWGDTKQHVSEHHWVGIGICKSITKIVCKVTTSYFQTSDILNKCLRFKGLSHMTFVLINQRLLFSEGNQKYCKFSLVLIDFRFSRFERFIYHTLIQYVL